MVCKQSNEGFFSVPYTVRVVLYIGIMEVWIFLPITQKTNLTIPSCRLGSIG